MAQVLKCLALAHDLGVQGLSLGQVLCSAGCLLVLLSLLQPSTFLSLCAAPPPPPINNILKKINKNSPRFPNISNILSGSVFLTLSPIHFYIILISVSLISVYQSKSML